MSISPWIMLWFQPRKTLRNQLEKDPYHSLIFLAILTGILNGCAWISYAWEKYPFADSLQRTNLVIASFSIGILLALFHLYFAGWLYRWTGSWIGGKGTFTELKCAVGWSFYPFIVTGVIGFLQNFLPIPVTIQAFIGIGFFLASIWALYILFSLIAEAHQFSLGKGALTFLLALMTLLTATFILSITWYLYRFLLLA